MLTQPCLAGIDLAKLLCLLLAIHLDQHHILMEDKTISIKLMATLVKGKTDQYLYFVGVLCCHNASYVYGSTTLTQVSATT